MSINIRLEKPEDWHIVEGLTRNAFSTPDRIERSEINCPMEHYMVRQLRSCDGIMELNFVAEMDGQIVGHIIYSHAHILQLDDTKTPVLNFGPLNVLPQYQSMGVGGALLNHSINKAKQLGHRAILFFGHPSYYPRFGFAPADNFSITDRNGNNYPAFMAMELAPGYLSSVSGKFIESDIFNDDINREGAKQYDKQFQ
ncbi:MAG: N-acetyltransferase [Defluviitaleaceae bacterium]|nr:N-acetyltransferase [Defluviitaleaceae bacterium]